MTTLLIYIGILQKEFLYMTHLLSLNCDFYFNKLSKTRKCSIVDEVVTRQCQYRQIAYQFLVAQNL